MTFTPPVITDLDIDQIKELFSGIDFDDERIKVLKCDESADIQAFPGTGKTTLLVAKLAILMSKWGLTHQGICVLSHTNVAKREIEKRLGKTVGAKLLNYPHFVGTIDSFLNTFISKPYLNDIGIKQHTIDTDIVVARREKQLSWTANTFFEKHHRKKEILQLKAWPKSYDIPCGPAAESYKNISQTINESIDNGDFTFEEIRLVAKYCIETQTDRSAILSNRFPVVFIDEAQDTTEEVWEILRQCFKNSVIQSFGDKNQAIYGNTSESEKINANNFASLQTKLTLSNSKRFGESIAKLADTLGLEKGLKGENSDFDHLSNQHTIFLFDKNNPKSVIEAFGQHILDNFSDDELAQNSDLGCHVLGQVHKTNENKNSEHQPQNIQFYFPQYEQPSGGTHVRQDNFWAFIKFGKDQFLSTHNCFDLCQALCLAIEYQLKKKNIATTFHASALRRISNSLPAEQGAHLREDIRNLLKTKKAQWVQIFENILTKYWNITNIEKTFYSVPTNNVVKPIKQSDAPNTLMYKDPSTERSVKLEFGTIHSAKGETHLCTLVVETFNYTHSLEKLIPFWTKHQPTPTKPRTLSRLKTHYVALTRAKALVCLAIPKNSVQKEEDRQALTKAGWQIKEI